MNRLKSDGTRLHLDPALFREAVSFTADKKFITLVHRKLAVPGNEAMWTSPTAGGMP